LNNGRELIPLPHAHINYYLHPLLRLPPAEQN